MLRPVLLVLALLVALLPATADAQRRSGPVKNQKASELAKQRQRGPNGRFLPMATRDKAIRAPLIARGRANPSGTGQSEAHIDLTPATRGRAGSMKVEIPEMYVGTANQPRTVQRQLFTTDIHGKQVAITGTLEVSGTRSSFAKATFRAEIPKGVTLSQRGVSQALRSLQVSDISLQWASKPAARGARPEAASPLKRF